MRSRENRGRTRRKGGGGGILFPGLGLGVWGGGGLIGWIDLVTP